MLRKIEKNRNLTPCYLDELHKLTTAKVTYMKNLERSGPAFLSQSCILDIGYFLGGKV